MRFETQRLGVIGNGKKTKKNSNGSEKTKEVNEEVSGLFRRLRMVPANVHKAIIMTVSLT